MPTHTNEFAGLSSAVGGARAQAGRLGGTLTRFMGQTDSLGPERSQLRGGLSASLAGLTAGAAGGNSFATTLGGTLRQAKARQGIVNRGEAAIRGQQLKDRLAIARLGLRKQQRGMGVLGQAANIREGVNLAEQEADQLRSNAMGDLLGGLAGGVAGLYKNRKPKFDPDTGFVTSSAEQDLPNPFTRVT